MLYKNMWLPLFAEFLGTFLLVFFGCLTAATNSGQVATGLAFGVVLLLMVYAFGPASGSHFNPQVSFSLALTGNISVVKMILYWIFQLSGALLAATILNYLLGAETGLGASVGSFTNTFPWKAVVVEAVITFIFITTVLYVVNNSSLSTVSGLIIGAGLFLAVMVGYPLTGGSANSWRSLAPAIFTGNLPTVWIYFVGPFIGAFVASIVYWALNRNTCKDNWMWEFKEANLFENML
jgi:aquaporin Z